jgi:hypothetical protein
LETENIYAEGNFFRELRLGAINGLGFGVLAELSARGIFTFQRNLVEQQHPLGPDWHILRNPYPWEWWYLPLLFLALTSIATVLIYARSKIKSVTWRWQLIGFLALIELYVGTLAWDLWNASRVKYNYWEFAYSTTLLPWITLIPALIVYNFLFGWATKKLRIGQRRR